jgi:GNAT superfamily N-acetyltransferase
MSQRAAPLAMMQANLATHMAWLQARLPGACVLDAADLLLVDSGFATDTFNTICRARLAPHGLDRRIGEVLGHFERVGRPFSWWVGPLDEPAELANALAEAGLVLAETEVAMAASLDQLGAVDPAPDGLRIQRVHTPRAVRDFAQVVAANWSPPDPLVLAYYAAATPMILRADCPLQFYVGYLEERPVAAAEVCLTGPVAGLYGVCTLASERRRGFGTALVARPLLEARAAGAQVATLQASAQGQPVYARLGFRPLGEYREYQLGR